MGSLTSQIANECCCEKSAVYNVKRGSWESPFQATAEYAAASDTWAKSAAAPPQGEAPTVVLVGGTGVGKSNLGNYLLGRVAFESRNSQESVTTSTSWIDGTWFGGRHPVRVVDCTGIGDTKGAYADQKQWDTTIEVLKTVGKVSALVMVMRAGRFTKFDKEVISILRESFGPCFWKNMCVFCTGASAKPGQLDLELEGPKVRRKLVQIEMEQGGNEVALQAIQRMQIYAADLDPVLCCPQRRQVEFKFKPALSGLGLEDLLLLDLKIPNNVMEMSGEEFRHFAASDPALERWIEGNYFQLGIARLAAFKNDVLAMEPFEVDGVARLADAPEPEDPPPAEVLGAPEEPPPWQAPQALGEDPLRYFTELEPIEEALRERDTVLIKGSFFERVHAAGGVLPRRQDLPADAICDPEVLIPQLRGKTGEPTPPIVAVSYCWLSQEHPDPAGVQLSVLAPLIQAFAAWHRLSSDRIAVFLDWCSLPQAPRSAGEAAAFDRALQHVYLWYAHATTNVWLLTRVPEGLIAYAARGWPSFEKGVSALGNPMDSALDIGLLRASWTTWGQVLQDCKVRVLPPLPPDNFAGELLRKAFSEAADREMLSRRYAEAFRGAMGYVERLHYAGLKWGDREAMRLAKILPQCSSLRELELQNNNISTKGAAALTSRLVSCPELERLCLLGNCMDDAAMGALRQAWLQCGKPEAGLEMGEQRPPVAGLDIVTSGGGMGTPGPLSPGGRSGLTPSGAPRSPTRRSAEELAALQMAELGARQAAFEARLHVAINRINNNLSEMSGDVAGTPKVGGRVGATPTGSLGLPGGGRL